jgi:Cof subfamily protein (haloacid dehalogenase superfamily)
MIVMDLDGTLLDDNKNISNYTLAILEKCKNIGIKIVIATARSEKEAERVIKLLKPDFMILNGGGLVLNKNRKIIYEKIISIEVSDKIIEKCTNNKNFGIITVETKKGYYLNYKNPEWHKDFMNGIYNDFSKPLSLEAYKIVFELNKEKIINEIQNEYSELNIVKFSGENWFGFYNKDAKKLLAIETVANAENINLKDIVAFGDDYNDLEMIKKCGIGMENAIEEVKNVAKYICENNNNDGVGKWIERNILKTAHTSHNKR